MSQAEEWSIKNLLEWTTSFFSKKGIDSPRLDAEVLLAFALKTTRVDLFVRYDEKPDESVRSQFRDLVRRRSLGEPVAYLVGKKEFYSLDFTVDLNVLIPRPETEQLVLETIEHIKKADKTASAESDDESLERRVWSICDVGVGSGCIAVALAKYVAKSRLVAIDVSASALDVAKKNAEKHKVADKIEFLEGNLLDSVPLDLPEERRFDIIASNPPYVSESEYDDLEPSVKNFEPKLALLGGPTGAELPVRLARQAPDRLKSGGGLFMELSPTTVGLVADEMKADGRWIDVEIRRDFARVDRFIHARRK